MTRTQPFTSYSNFYQPRWDEAVVKSIRRKNKRGQALQLQNRRHTFLLEESSVLSQFLYFLFFSVTQGDLGCSIHFRAWWHLGQPPPLCILTNLLLALTLPVKSGAVSVSFSANVTLKTGCQFSLYWELLWDFFASTNFVWNPEVPKQCCRLMYKPPRTFVA